MEIELMYMQGIEPALLGVGLSYGLTSEHSFLRYVPEEKKNRIVQIAGSLAKKGGGEDKFLRQIICWWDPILVVRGRHLQSGDNGAERKHDAYNNAPRIETGRL